MEKKLLFYLTNSNFKETEKIKKKSIEIRKSQDKEDEVLKIVNGEIFLDDNEMFINLNKKEDMEVVEDTNLVTSATYCTKKRRSSRWSRQETEYFFEALSLCGLEFTLISELFKSKDRKSCRLKYHKELKKNNIRVMSFLNKKIPFCPQKYKLLLNKICNMEK